MAQYSFLSLNCQKGYNPALWEFLRSTIESGAYDFLILQEATENVIVKARDAGAYKLVEAFNEEAGGTSHLAILYRDTFALKESSLCSVSKMHPATYLQHPGFGVLMGRFDVGGKTVSVGSLHLHSGFSRGVRAREIQRISEYLSGRGNENELTVFGGDCNFGPGERAHAARTLDPEFICVTGALGATLDSRYTERVPGSIINALATVLAKARISIKLKTDHFFVDSESAIHSQSHVRILADRVSDHSPVELVVEI